MEVDAVRDVPGTEPIHYRKIRVEPGAPEVDPYQQWLAAGHASANWTFGVPKPPPPPVSAVVATRIGRALAVMAHATWAVTVLAAHSIPASAAQRREARLSRPMKSMLPEHRRKYWQATLFLVYALAVTGLLFWPNLQAAYQYLVAQWHWALQNGALLPGGLLIRRER